MNRRVARELLRAGWDAAALPARVADEYFRREALRAELVSDLAAPSAPLEERPIGALPERPLTLFLSCAETSGEGHALTWLEALRKELAARGAPPARVLGLGGERLAAAQVELVGRPVERAAMGLSKVAGSLPYYLGLLSDASRALERARADLFLAVDSPALHAPLGRIARRLGIPSVHLAAPQMWGWASWRARGYASAFDRVLTILPFEPTWFARRDVACVHVGHPLLDQVPAQPSPPELADGTHTLALLPGSRAAVLERHLPWMLARCRELRTAFPDLDVAVLPADPRSTARAQAWLERSGTASFARIETAPLHAVLARCRSAFSVSGTVLIDLLIRRLPTVVVYRLGSAREACLGRHMLLSPYFASPNLLAGERVLEEFAFAGEGPQRAVREALVRCHGDLLERARIRSGLDRAAARLGPPGAARRAARAALELCAPATSPFFPLR